MKTGYLAAQGMLSAGIAWVSAKLGLLFAPLIVLVIMMVADYITGMLASKTEAILHPEDPAYGWSSRKGVLGIIKKVGYVSVIATACCLDLIISNAAARLGFDAPAEILFGLVVTVWFVLNEMLSVIENAGRMGAPVPQRLAKYIAVLKGKLEEGDGDE